MILFFFLPKTIYTGYDKVLLGDNMTVKITTIKLKPETRDVLASVGSKGQTYDEIIRMLLQNYDESITFDNYK